MPFQADGVITDQSYQLPYQSARTRMPEITWQHSTSSGYGLLWGQPELPSSHVGSKQLQHDKLKSVLESYRLLPIDWDGYGGAPAIRQSIQDAIAFLGRLPMHLDTPKAMLSGSGEVSLFWEHDGSYAEASFPGDGTFHFIFDSEHECKVLDALSTSDIYLQAELLSCIEAIND